MPVLLLNTENKLRSWPLVSNIVEGFNVFFVIFHLCYSFKGFLSIGDDPVGRIVMFPEASCQPLSVNQKLGHGQRPRGMVPAGHFDTV